MPPWLAQLVSAQRKETDILSTKWIQLATVGLDKTPRVRTVVFRGWSDTYEMQILTDKRSQKFYELDLNNNVEICWLFLKSKCQFRFRGTSRIDLSDDRLRSWDKLDDHAKSMWGWPEPGKKISSETIENSFLTNSVIDNFILLKINITLVDHLLLSKPIHIRRRWIKKK